MIIVMFLLGLVIGSFSNVVIQRYPFIAGIKKNKSIKNSFHALIYPSSMCLNCKKKINWFNNVPLFSYIFLRGKCNGCKVSFGKMYFINEIISGLAFSALCFFLPTSLEVTFACIVFFILVCLFWIDLKYFLLPNFLTVPLIFLGLGYNYLLGMPFFINSLIGTAAGYLSFWLLFKAHYLIKKTEGLGYGDFKLFAAFGAIFGWVSLPIIAVLSSLLGIAAVLYKGIILKKSLYDAIPFGPFLIASSVIYFIEQKNNYISLFMH
jgi:leader peptidase (prepilin peptidase)/N-methyltransferase